MILNDSICLCMSIYVCLFMYVNLCISICVCLLYAKSKKSICAEKFNKMTG